MVLDAGGGSRAADAGASGPLANEFDLLSEPRPTSNYVLDDANVLNKTTKKALNYDLAQLEVRPWPRGLCCRRPLAGAMRTGRVR